MVGHGVPYTLEEKHEILEYIIKKNAYYEVNGREFWRDMEKNFSKPRTWQSLKNHFRRTLYPMIHDPSMNLTEHQIKMFRNGFKRIESNRYMLDEPTHSRDAGTDLSTTVSKSETTVGSNKEAATETEDEAMDEARAVVKQDDSIDFDKDENDSYGWLYTMAEKHELLQYIIVNDAYYKVNGEELWKRMHNDFSTRRSWQSLREQFRRTLYPTLHYPSLELKRREIQMFRCGFMRIETPPESLEPEPSSSGLVSTGWITKRKKKIEHWSSSDDDVVIVKKESLEPEPSGSGLVSTGWITKRKKKIEDDTSSDDDVVIVKKEESPTIMIESSESGESEDLLSGYF